MNPEKYRRILYVFPLLQIAIMADFMLYGKGPLTIPEVKISSKIVLASTPFFRKLIGSRWKGSSFFSGNPETFSLKLGGVGNATGHGLNVLDANHHLSLKVTRTSPASNNVDICTSCLLKMILYIVLSSK